VQHKRPLFHPITTVSAVVSIAVLLGIFMFSFALGRGYAVLTILLSEVDLSVVTEWWSDGWIPTPEPDAVVSLIALRPFVYSPPPSCTVHTSLT